MAKRQPTEPEIAPGYGDQRREREVRNTRRILMGMISAIYIVALIASVLAMHARYQDVVNLAQSGRTVEATVTDRSRSKEHPGDYYVDYAFVVQGRKITGYQKVSKHQYEQTRMDGPVTITYLPSNPKLQDWGVVTQENVAADRRSSFWAFVFLIVMFSFTLGIVWLCLPKVHKAHRVFFKRD